MPTDDERVPTSRPRKARGPQETARAINTETPSPPTGKGRKWAAARTHTSWSLSMVNTRWWVGGEKVVVVRARNGWHRRGSSTSARARACRAHPRGRRSQRQCRQRGLLRGVGVATTAGAHAGGSWAGGGSTARGSDGALGARQTQRRDGALRGPSRRRPTACWPWTEGGVPYPRPQLAGGGGASPQQWVFWGGGAGEATARARARAHAAKAEVCGARARLGHPPPPLCFWVQVPLSSRRNRNRLRSTGSHGTIKAGVSL